MEYPFARAIFGDPDDPSATAQDSKINSRMAGFIFRRIMKVRYDPQEGAFHGRGRILGVAIRDWHDKDRTDKPHYSFEMSDHPPDDKINVTNRIYTATVKYCDYQSVLRNREIQNNPGEYGIIVSVKASRWPIVDRILGYCSIRRIAKAYEEAMEDAYPDYYVMTAPLQFGVYARD